MEHAFEGTTYIAYQEKRAPTQAPGVLKRLSAARTQPALRQRTPRLIPAPANTLTLCLPRRSALSKRTAVVTTQLSISHQLGNNRRLISNLLKERLALSKSRLSAVFQLSSPMTLLALTLKLSITMRTISKQLAQLDFFKRSHLQQTTKHLMDRPQPHQSHPILPLKIKVNPPTIHPHLNHLSLRIIQITVDRDLNKTRPSLSLPHRTILNLAPTELLAPHLLHRMEATLDLSDLSRMDPGQ